MFNKKGQGLSLNVIIVAALALIVLVVLIMVFTGRIAVFDQGLGDEGDTEMVKLRITYGDCQPGATLETTYKINYAKATDDNAKALASAAFKDEISRCKGFSNDKGVCESNTGCKWS